MNKVILISIASLMGVAILGFCVMLGQRFYHNYERKRSTVNTYAIQNVKTGMNIRPCNAGIADDVKIVQYKHAQWECMTWQMIKLEDGSYLLKNLYTHKTFQPMTEPKSGVALWQRSLEANQYQYWEFIKEENEEYLIRLKGTDLYVTASGNKINAAIILLPLQNTTEQQWKLIEQHPIM